MRFKETDECTYGVMHVNGFPRFVTLELPWRNNERNVSCIPVGSYECSQFRSRKYGSTIRVNSVPERSGIIFHVGNFPEDTRGCVLVGTGFSTYRGSAIIESKRAMENFREMLRSEKNINLTVWNVH